MSDYVITANEIFIALEDNLETFEKEALLLDEIKCHLMNYGNLNDFVYGDVEIVERGYGYSVYYEFDEMLITVQDKMIIDIEYC